MRSGFLRHFCVQCYKSKAELQNRKLFRGVIFVQTKESFGSWVPSVTDLYSWAYKYRYCFNNACRYYFEVFLFCGGVQTLMTWLISLVRRT